MFHKFEPLQQKIRSSPLGLEQMVQRAGQDIPPQKNVLDGRGREDDRINAYVTGIGASKRIVVWDTTIAKMNTPQIVFVAGHEMGHYVLQHIPKLMAFSALLLLVLFYLGYRTIGVGVIQMGREMGHSRTGRLGLAASLIAIIVGIFVLSQSDQQRFQPPLRTPGRPVWTGSDPWPNA